MFGTTRVVPVLLATIGDGSLQRSTGDHPFAASVPNRISSAMTRTLLWALPCLLPMIPARPEAAWKQVNCHPAWCETTCWGEPGEGPCEKKNCGVDCDVIWVDSGSGIGSPVPSPPRGPGNPGGNPREDPNVQELLKCDQEAERQYNARLSVNAQVEQACRQTRMAHAAKWCTEQISYTPFDIGSTDFTIYSDICTDPPTVGLGSREYPQRIGEWKRACRKDIAAHKTASQRRNCVDGLINGGGMYFTKLKIGLSSDVIGIEFEGNIDQGILQKCKEDRSKANDGDDAILKCARAKCRKAPCG